jgi:hypothetical protein
LQPLIKYLIKQVNGNEVALTQNLHADGNDIALIEQLHSKDAI